MMTNYDGFKWIKVKHYKMDESKSWEERYKELETHHVEETTFLINEVRKLSDRLDSEYYIQSEQERCQD